MTNRLRASAERFSTESTIHGMLEIWQLRLPAKLLWSTLILVMLALCSVQVRDLVVDFLDEPQITSITELSDLNDPPLHMIIYTRGTLYHQLQEEYEQERDDRIGVEIWDEYPFAIPQPFLQQVMPSYASLPKMIQNDHRRSVHNIYSAAIREVLFPGAENFARCPRYPKAVSENIANLAKKVESYKNEGKLNSSVETPISNDSVIAGIKALYESAGTAEKILKLYHFKKPLKAPARRDGEDSEESPRKMMTILGLAFQVKVSDQVYKGPKFTGDPSQAKRISIVSPDCEDGKSLYIVRIGGDYSFPDHVDPYFLHRDKMKVKDLEIRCETGKVYHIIVRVRKHTFDKLYCKPDMKTLCLTDCMIKDARKAKKCLRHLGVPEFRKDILLCGLQSENCDPEIFQTCRDKCVHDETNKQCASYDVISLNQQKNTHGTGPTNISVTVELGSGSEHVHLAPKYSTSSFISGIGGIAGLGLGISIVSLLQILGVIVRMNNPIEDSEDNSSGTEGS